MKKNYTVKKKNKNRKRRTKPIFFICAIQFFNNNFIAYIYNLFKIYTIYNIRV